MDRCGNDAPVMWMLHVRGYDLHAMRKRETEVERELRLSREENAALRRALMVVDAADHGVPQHRRRLFVVGTRSRHPVHLELPRREHQAAGRTISLTSGKWSAIDRPGRSVRTLARVAAGRRQFGERFLAPYYGSGSGETGRSLDRPIGTLTTRARWALIDGDRMRMVSAVEGRELMGFGPQASASVGIRT